MAKDYARNRYSRPSRPIQLRQKHLKSRENNRIKSILFSGIWLVIGLLIGFGSSAFLFLKHSPKVESAANESTPAKTVAENKNTSAKESSPQFDFYTILPEKTGEDKSAPKKSTAKAEPQKYLLQVASVKSSDDADRLKAQLSLLGFSVSISQPIAGSAWYRVNVGPFKSQAEAEKQQKRLRANDLKSTLISVKQSA